MKDKEKQHKIKHISNTMKKIGSRLEVMHGKATQTGGGLRITDLKLNNSGGIVSVRASNAAKKNNNLVGAGYVVEKGTFGSKYIGSKYIESKYIEGGGININSKSPIKNDTENILTPKSGKVTNKESKIIKNKDSKITFF